MDCSEDKKKAMQNEEMLLRYIHGMESEVDENSCEKTSQQKNRGRRIGGEVIWITSSMLQSDADAPVR